MTLLIAWLLCWGMGANWSIYVLFFLAWVIRTIVLIAFSK